MNTSPSSNLSQTFDDYVMSLEFYKKDTESYVTMPVYDPRKYGTSFEDFLQCDIDDVILNVYTAKSILLNAITSMDNMIAVRNNMDVIEQRYFRLFEEPEQIFEDQSAVTIANLISVVGERLYFVGIYRLECLLNKGTDYDAYLIARSMNYSAFLEAMSRCHVPSLTEHQKAFIMNIESTFTPYS